MPNFRSDTVRSAYYLAVFGAIIIPVGILLQYLINTGPMVGVGITLLPTGTFLMIYGTLMLYLGNMVEVRFPDRFTSLAIFAIILGIALSFVPILYPATFLTFELPGPLVFSFGLVILVMQLHLRYRLRLRNVVIASVFMDAAGILIPTIFQLFTGSGLLSLAILPAVSGVFLLDVPLSKRSFTQWKDMGYFQ